ncbi:hypothetical protein Ciccas_005039 [Cichlidogyrus casuarinus]|uniref:Uncharacterized protein n=1 Tax=Cichlidogyrus casuarinus TaxID=1844966 RepID=A0ABD2Q9S9_9PLAT
MLGEHNFLLNKSRIFSPPPPPNVLMALLQAQRRQRQQLEENSLEESSICSSTASTTDDTSPNLLLLASLKHLLAHFQTSQRDYPAKAIQIGSKLTGRSLDASAYHSRLLKTVTLHFCLIPANGNSRNFDCTLHTDESGVCTVNAVRNLPKYAIFGPFVTSATAKVGFSAGAASASLTPAT